MDILVHKLTCSSCGNIFQEPKILPCLHTFCKSCIRAFMIETCTLCPICNKKVGITKIDELCDNVFLYRAFGTVIHRCNVRNYDGDGISFQQSNDVTVTECTVEGNSQLGLHPGSGSQRATIKKCIARNNGTDGLFLCWRVRHGLFEDNILENNGRFGISIGHKDSDNLLQRNQVRKNHSNGIFFRNESEGMAAHRRPTEAGLDGHFDG